MLETWFWSKKSMLWDVKNHLGQFPEASDRHEGQKLDCEVKEDFKKRNSILGSKSASEHARDMVLVSKPMFSDMGNHLEPFLGRSEASENGLK